MTPFVLAGLLAAFVASPVHAQVFKCVDAQGHTTYQQAPCDKSVKGSRVEITTDNGATSDAPQLEAQWATAAKQGQIQPGMPKRYVQAAWGLPSETRAGTPAERAGEVWIYRNASGLKRVGFVDGRVSWERGEDVASGDTTRRDGAGDPVARRRDVTTGQLPIAPGQDCEAALAIAGSPDRSEAVRLPGSGTGTPTTGMRHVYENDGGSPPQRMAILCVNGLVNDIERPAR